MRYWREQEFAKGLAPPTARYGTRAWGFVARRPALYHLGARGAGGRLGLLDRLTGRRGRVSRLPLAGGWPVSRDLPAPAGQPCQSLGRARGARP
jgi:L-lactate dehydrogenase complex protein LldF